MERPSLGVRQAERSAVKLGHGGSLRGCWAAFVLVCSYLPIAQPPGGDVDRVTVRAESFVFKQKIRLLVLKMYLGFCFHSDMMRPANQEMSITVKTLYSASSREEGTCHTVQSHTRGHRRWSQLDTKGRFGKAFPWFFRERVGEAEEAG